MSKTKELFGNGQKPTFFHIPTIECMIFFGGGREKRKQESKMKRKKINIYDKVKF